MKRAACFAVLAYLTFATPALASSYTDAEIRAVETATEKSVRELQNQEINQLRIALGRRLPVNRRPDLYLRLAEIYLEAYRTAFLQEGRVHEKRLAAGTTDKFLDRTHSKPYLALAIKACNDLLALKVPYAKMDQVYYFLGFNHSELGNRKESIRYFETLVTKYPNTSFATEAYREMGDAAFESTQYRKAMGYYELALKGKAEPGSIAVPRVLHRLAWTYYRTRQFDRAVDTLKDAIAKASSSGEKLIALRDEALRDMAVFMTEGGKADEAVAYFAEVAGDKDYYSKALERLAREYERNVEPLKAIQVYEALLKTSSGDEAAFRARVKLVDLELRRGRYTEALGRIEGAKLLTDGDAETQTAATNLKAMIRRTATEHHERFRKKADRTALGTAESFYEAYLKYFLSKKDARTETPEIQMYLAEVKRDLGKLSEATALYQRVIDSGDKRYSKEAGVLWLGTLADAIKKGSGTKAQQASKLELEYVKAADQLLESLGPTPEAREATLRAAQILAGYSSSAGEARKRIAKVIESWPKTQQAITAARLRLQLEVDRGDSGDIKDAIKDIQKNSQLMAFDAETGGKLKTAMADQETRLKVDAIAEKEKDRDFEGAAKGYEAFAAETPRQDVAEKALASAVASYLKAAQPDAVERVAGQWLKKFGASKAAIDSIRSAATAFLIQGKWDTSTSLFEKLGLTGGDPDSLLTAARLAEGKGDPARGMRLKASFADLYKGSPARWDLLLAIARAHDAAGRDSEASAAYKACQAGPARYAQECGARLADLYFKTKDYAAAKGLYKQVAAAKPGADSSPFLAYARYKLAEQHESEAKLDELKMPEAQLKKAIASRTEVLDALSKSYLSAIEAGGPWAIAASARLARWVVAFARDVDSIQPPAGYDAAALDRFKKSLAGLSGPLRQKALNTWTDAYQRAVQSEVLAPTLPEIADGLADSRAGGAHRAQGVVTAFRWAGIPLDGGDEGRSKAFTRVRSKLASNPLDAAAWTDYGNLLVGDDKPLLAALCYDRALSINRKASAALANRGVLLISDGEKSAPRLTDWIAATEANAYFAEALKADDLLVAAKVNRGIVLNYYRLFAKAKPLWEQASAKLSEADVMDGYAIALQGTGSGDLAQTYFGKARDAGASKSRFAEKYHAAARADSSEKCLKALDDIGGEMGPFEKEAQARLKRTCSP